MIGIFAWGSTQAWSGRRSCEAAWGAKSGHRSFALKLLELTLYLRLEVVELVFLLMDPVVADVKNLVVADVVELIVLLSDAVAIPHGVWEFPDVGRKCLKVMPESGVGFFFDT